MLKTKNDNLKELSCCSQCGKRARPNTSRNGATGWILTLGSCKCDRTEQPLKDDSDSAARSERDKSVVDEPIPTEIDGVFEVLSVLGKGGTGTVYRVRNKSTNAVLALKLIHPALSKDAAAVKRFEHEAQAVSELDHPNLVAVYGHGKTKSGESYLLMDFVEGESLARIIEREGALDEPRAIEIFSQICAALSYAHEQNLVHRDLKPANIILSKTEDGEEIAKVVDFGIAKTLPSDDRETRDLTQTGEVFGSPHYMSPEQCLGFMLDQRSDIYSFGCLMYEALSGKPPFAGSNPIQLVVKHINDAPKPFLQQFNATIKMKGLQSIILKCLEKEQIDRWQTVDEVFDALTRVRIGRSAYSYHSTRRNSLVIKGMLPLAWIAPALITIVSVSALFVTTMSSIFPDYHPTNVQDFPVAFSVAVLLSTVFYLPAYQLSKITTEGKVPKLNAWSINSLFLSGLIITGTIPAVISIIFCPGEMLDAAKFGISLPFIDVFAVLGMLVSAIAMVGTMVCSVGVLIDRGPKKIKITSITPRIFLISCVLVILLPFMFQKPSAWIAARIATTCSSFPSQITGGAADHLIGYALSKEPTNLDVLEYAVTVSKNEKQYADTVKFCDMILQQPKLNESTISSYGWTRANALEELGQFDKAVVFYSKQVEEEPERYDYRKQRGGCLIKAKLFDDAISDYDELIRIFPTEPMSYYLRANAYLAKDRPDKALESINQRMKLREGTTTSAYLIKAYAFEKMGNIALAKQEYLNSKNAVIWKGYGYSIQNTHLAKALACHRLGDKNSVLDQIKQSKVTELTARQFDFQFELYPAELQSELKEILVKHGIFLRP